MSKIYKRLASEVIKSGLCTHCGTCAGLSGGAIEMTYKNNTPYPELVDNSTELNEEVYAVCPGKGYNYVKLTQFCFNTYPDNWITGVVKKSGVGYSKNDAIRLLGASGGVITQTLIYLLDSKKIDGAVLVKLGVDAPWKAWPVIATTKEEIMACAQSVYAPVPVNAILEKTARFKGNLAYVGLPDQVAAVRTLQMNGHESVSSIKYILGPYVGINMYQNSLLSFLKSNGYKSLDDIKELKYRDGEWPGYLSVKTKDGNIFKAEKFYYNYLLPFYITRYTKYAIDFANDFTDISVGDAWNPKYEKIGKGFAVVLARTQKGQALLDEMVKNNHLAFDEQTVEEVSNMHGHMFDFKKRGAFIRIRFRKLFFKKAPDYNIKLEKVAFSRILVEIFISSIMAVCSTWLSRKIIQLIPIPLMGKIFNFIRIRWKTISKPTKRKGLLEQNYKLNTSNK
jgi:coenzyme F420 hydrogenase subunit beta